jgi:hypothetical protein
MTKGELNRFLMYIGGDQILQAHADDVDGFLEQEKQFKQEKQSDLISSVRLSCLQEVWQAWCESDKMLEFDKWLHDKMHEA